MNQIEIMDFFLQMQADFDLPDSKIYDRYFQVGWQNALLPYGQRESLEALQEYAESPLGVNRPRIANIVGIIRKNRTAGNPGALTAERAWGEVEKACANGILWAGEEKKALFLSGIAPKCRLALAEISGCKAGCSEEETDRGAFRALVKIASTDLSGIREIKAAFEKAYERQDRNGEETSAVLLTGSSEDRQIPEKEAAPQIPAAKDSPKEENVREKRAGVPKYILDIIEKRKQQYRNEQGET